MTTFLIPLTNVPQTFQIALAGVDYDLTCRWNAAPEAGWVIDLGDANSGTPLVANIPLVTGVDLLSGLEYLEIGGTLEVVTAGNATAVPTLDNLGVESNVYFIVE